MIPYEKNYCVSSSYEGSVYVWDVVNQVSVLKMNHHKGPVTDLVFVGAFLISVGQDGLILVLDPTSG